MFVEASDGLEALAHGRHPKVGKGLQVLGIALEKDNSWSSMVVHHEEQS